VWTQENWSKVHFNNESKFYLGQMGNIMFGVKLEKDPECVKKSVKGGGGSLMFCAAGVGTLIHLHGRVNANVCQNLQQQDVVPSRHSLPNQSAIFMQDNSPSHTAEWVKQFLEANNTEIMTWPAQSPDLNTIQNLWKILGNKVMAKKPTTITKLWKRLEEDCTNIIIQSMAYTLLFHFTFLLQSSFVLKWLLFSYSDVFFSNKMKGF